MDNIKFDLKDIAIVPTIISDIGHRSECTTYYDGLLPLMAAPMDTVICKKNYLSFVTNKIVVCMPRGEHHPNKHFADKDIFQSYGLGELEYQIESFIKLLL